MKKEPINLSKLKDSQISIIQNALANKPKGEVKQGVDLVGLAQTLAKRHVEKLKAMSTEE
jgi:hypothetical protein